VNASDSHNSRGGPAGSFDRPEGEGKMKNPLLHPTLRLRFGAAAETSLLVGTFIAIWISVGWILIAAILG